MSVGADRRLASTVDARADRLREAAGASGLDAVLVTSDASLEYFTGFSGLQLERFMGAVIHRDGGGALIVPALEAEVARAAATSLERVVYTAASDGLPELTSALADARTVGVEEDHLIAARAWALERSGFQLVPAGRTVMDLRARKDDGEVAAIREACRVVAEELERLLGELRPGDVEHEANARIEHRLKERGATDSHALVLFGENAANPHAKPGPRALAPGDVVCADVSARIDGYWGDLTRCATVGPASDWAAAAWEVVRRAQQAAIEATREGAEARAVDAAQRTIVEGAAALGECLHGAGHAIGLEVHEPPFLVPRTTEPLAAGMVLTIEPGLYRPGVGGIRLEDDVLVTTAGPELLSELPLELREIPV